MLTTDQIREYLRRIAEAGQATSGGKTRQEYIVSNKNGVIVRVDPVTIETVIAVATIVLDVVKLFKQGPDLSQIDQQLREIHGELNAIKRQLNTVIRLIEDLYKYVPLAVSIEFQAQQNREVLAWIETITKHFGDYESAGAIPNEVSYGLEHGIAALRLGGFTHYNTVGLGLFYEMALLRLQKASKETQLKALDLYAQYFLSALDPAVEGSIAFRKKRIDDQIAEALQTDQNMARPLGEKVGEWVDECRPGSGEYTKYYSMFRIYEWNVDTGITATQDYGELDRLGNRCRVGNGWHDSTRVEAVAPHIVSLPRARPSTLVSGSDLVERFKAFAELKVASEGFAKCLEKLAEFQTATAEIRAKIVAS